MNFNVNVSLEDDVLKAGITNLEYSESALKVKYCFYLLRDGYVEQSTGYSDRDSITFKLEDSGAYAVQGFVKQNQKPSIRFSDKISFFPEEDSSYKYNEIESDLGVDLFKNEYPFFDFVISNRHLNVDCFNLKDEEELLSDTSVKGWNVYSNATRSSSNTIISGVANVDGMLLFGNDDIEGIEPQSLSDSVGNFTSIEVKKEKIDVVTDFFGIGKVYYYESGTTKIVSNNYHLLILSLLQLGIPLKLDKDKAKALLISVRLPILHQNFSDTMDIEGILLKRSEKSLTLTSSGFEFSDSPLKEYMETTKKEVTDEEYRSCLLKASEEIKSNVSAILKDDRFDNILVDLTGGVDSRIIFSALTNFKDVKDRVRLNTKDIEGLPDLDVSLRVNSLYKFSYDDLPRMVSSIPGSFAAKHFGSTFGRYYSFGQSPVTRKLAKKAIRLPGIQGGIFRNYLSERYLEKFGNKHHDLTVNDFVDLYYEENKHNMLLSTNKEAVQAFKKILASEIDKADGASALEKFDNQFLYYRCGFHFGNPWKFYVDVPEFGCLQSKSLFKLKVMTYGNIESMKIPLDLVRILNPIVSQVEYGNIEYNDYQLGKSDSLWPLDPIYNNLCLGLKADPTLWDEAENLRRSREDRFVTKSESQSDASSRNYDFKTNAQNLVQYLQKNYVIETDDAKVLVSWITNDKTKVNKYFLCLHNKLKSLAIQVNMVSIK